MAPTTQQVFYGLRRKACGIIFAEANYVATITGSTAYSIPSYNYATTSTTTTTGTWWSSNQYISYGYGYPAAASTWTVASYPGGFSVNGSYIADFSVKEQLQMQKAAKCGYTGHYATRVEPTFGYRFLKVGEEMTIDDEYFNTERWCKPPPSELGTVREYWCACRRKLKWWEPQI